MAAHFFLLILSSPLWAQSRILTHSTCGLYIHKENISTKNDKKVLAFIEKKISQKGFKLKNFDAKKQLSPGEFHLTIKIKHHGENIFKECQVETDLRQAKTHFAISSDTPIFNLSSNRKFPRQTFKGKERCIMAAQDVLVTYPLCTIPAQ